MRIFLPLLTIWISATSAVFAAAPMPPPKLVVAIVVDQLRYDYLERFHDQFCEGGFKLLTDTGTFLTSAHYDYIPTITAPGHASFFSGAPPAAHGIIGNDWFDKRTKKGMYCVSDPTVLGVGTDYEDGRMSPRNFIGGNLSDEMRLRYHSKVIAISLKDRGAVLPGGKMPTGAYWWDADSGNFVTSTYYRPELPEWVNAFNKRRRAAEFIGQKWTRLLKPEAYQWEDVLPGEGNLPGELHPVFDHEVYASTKGDLDNVRPTPFGNQLLLEFAQAALDGEQLGRGEQPDVFCVSFSSVDAVGHKFGPYSQEMQDVVLRLDLQLAELLGAIDKAVGLKNVALVLTADHGVAPTPEFANSQGLGGQRFDSVTSMGDLVAKLTARFGTSKVLLTPRLVEGNLYFDHDVIRQLKITVSDVTTFIREWALSSGFFQAAYGREQILQGLSGELGTRVCNGFNAERSGDMVLVYKPYTIAWSAKTGTTHGSGYAYDTHVPVIFYGAQFVPGRFADRFNITDIAPTLAAALHCNEPAGSIGKPLVKILAEQPENAKPAPVVAVPVVEKSAAEISPLDASSSASPKATPKPRKPKASPSL